MLLKHMEKKKGKNFSIQSADQIARQMADENIDTVEAAEDFLSRDQADVPGHQGGAEAAGEAEHNPSEDQLRFTGNGSRTGGSP